MHLTPTQPEERNDYSCAGLPHPHALRGLELFNQGNYFQAHESLEEAWRAETGPVRNLYQGILQIGVAYYHILRGNYRGAVNLLRRGCNHLEGFPDVCRGINIAQLRANARVVAQTLQRLGPESIRSFNPGLLKQVIFDAAAYKQQK